VSLRLQASTWTPLMRLTVSRQKTDFLVWIKLEGENPSGSIKWRTAVGLLDSLQQRGLLQPGSTVIESTSGSLGVALAQILKQMDCHLIAVVDPKLSAQRAAKLEECGATLLRVTEKDTYGSYLSSRLHVLKAKLKEDTSLCWTNQYGNPAASEIHREVTSSEIRTQAFGLGDAASVAGAVGTGATIAGLRAGLSGIMEVIAVDVVGSRAVGGCGAEHLLSGIGSSRRSLFLPKSSRLSTIYVNDYEAIAYCRTLARDTGLVLGGSSGAILAAVVRQLRVPSREQPFICVSPDMGDDYISTIYSGDWCGCHRVLNDVLNFELELRQRHVGFSVDARTSS
jgi:N-(2-amino-2-carboxyethyl)-L-glutamate synthase